MMKYLIFSLLCILFLFTCPACSPKTASIEDVVIRVGDRLITVGDIERIVNITSLENAIPKKVIWSSVSSLVDRIVDDSLILEYGRDKGITLSGIELERAIQDIVKDYPENTFKETLITMCINYNDWKERLREKLLIKKIVDREKESLTPISHDAIRSYYEEREEDFRHPPRARFMHILSKTRREAELVLARLNGGEDMAKLVKEQPIFAGIQGDHSMNWATQDTLPQPLSDVVFSITVGELSTIIKTPYGFHIIKVIEREPAGTRKLLEVMAEIENALLSEAAEMHYRVWLKELRDRYPVKVNYSLLDKISATNEAN